MVAGAGSRERRGFGEITKLASGRYRARYRGPDRQRHTAPLTFASRMGAEAWLAAQHQIISSGAWRPRAVGAAIPVTLGEYATTALERRRLRPGTASLYQRLLTRQILPVLGHEMVADITSMEITRWYLSMAATPTEQANAYGLLRSILKDAVEEGLIQRNPAQVRGGSQKAPPRDIDVLTIDQLNRYVAAVPARHRVPLLLTGWCGLRSGEARGLRVKDLDLDEGVVRVRQAVVRLPGQLLIQPPRTTAAVRDIAIPPHLLPALRDWMSAQLPRHPDSLLFPASDGVSPLNDTVLRHSHHQARKAINMPGLTIHGLRHTSATLAAQQGATIADLQARMGHATSLMALRYQDAAIGRDRALAVLLTRIFRKIVAESGAPDGASAGRPASLTRFEPNGKGDLEWRRAGTSPRTPESRKRAAAVRAWAMENGYQLATRGRIGQAIIDAYESENLPLSMRGRAHQPEGGGRISPTQR